MSDPHRNALPQGYALAEYRIEGVLGAGGFGITYLAVEADTGRRVALKEYLPKGLATRDPAGLSVRPLGPEEAEGFAWGLARFVDEARTLVRLRHPNIVMTLRFFRAHGTAYLAMDYVEGESLGQRLGRVGRLGAAELSALLSALIDGLRVVHGAGFLHRDIKPDNIYLRSDTGAPVLLDFGAAREALGRSRHSLTAIFSAGYAPYEQYGEAGGDQGAWTDIYALAATAYRCLSGERPAPAPDRVRAMVSGRPDPLRPAAAIGAGRYDPALLAAIDAGLAIREADRPQTLDAFQALLRAGRAMRADMVEESTRPSAAVGETLVAGAAPPRNEPERPRRSGRVVQSVAALALIAIVAVIVWPLLRDSGHPSAPLKPGEGSITELLRREQREKAQAEAEEAKRKAEADATRPGREFRDCAECPPMVVIPAGTFTMGSPAGEADRADNEGPQRRVTVPQPFALGKYEVTFEEWDACAAARGCTHRPADEGWGRGRNPVVNVSWADAREYVTWLSRRTGRAYRLPSEAEWEYAARAGTTTPFHTGATISTDDANYVGHHTYGAGRPGAYRARTLPVGSLARNAFGLYDMHGNVWEWVQDCGTANYAGAPATSAARENGACDSRTIRGGSWDSKPAQLRSAVRVGFVAGSRVDFIGFRVARSL